MKDHYPSEKFLAAAKSLAVSPQSLQERIASAFTYNLIHLRGNPSLPHDVALKLSEYEDAWETDDDPKGVGTISVWASQLTDDQAREIARWIWDAAWKLEREYWKPDKVAQLAR